MDTLAALVDFARAYPHVVASFWVGAMHLLALAIHSMRLVHLLIATAYFSAGFWLLDHL